MRFQLTLILLFISLTTAKASDDKTVNELFKKYDDIMIHKKFDSINEVFTKKFLFDNGGKDEFIAKVKTLPPEKKNAKTEVTWKKGIKHEIYFVKIKPDKANAPDEPEFILKNEDGKLKIDGTLSDGE